MCQFYMAYKDREAMEKGKIVFERDANGDGEVVCFSKNEGIFVRIFEGKTTEINDFACVLKEIMGYIFHERHLILTKKRHTEDNSVMNFRMIQRTFAFTALIVGLGHTPWRHLPLRKRTTMIIDGIPGKYSKANDEYGCTGKRVSETLKEMAMQVLNACEETEIGECQGGKCIFECGRRC